MTQGGELHQAHVQSFFQAYMRDLEFRIDHNANLDNSDRYAGALPLYIAGDSFPEDRFNVIDVALHRCCGHVCCGARHAHDVAMALLMYAFAMHHGTLSTQSGWHAGTVHVGPFKGL